MENNILSLEEEIEKTRNSLSTDRLDMSFGEIMSMYERDEIIIDPDFQRLFRWTEEQKSRFIETILLGIPIPPIFVAEDEHGRWELVDGLQRISTIFSFFGLLKTLPERNNWSLLEGDLIKSQEGFNRESLPLKFQLNIKRSTCRIEIIRWNSKYDMRFELFNRLNTGGSPLTNQEIRNCIYRGTSTKFNDFLKKMAANPDFVNLVKPTEEQIEELYLEELALRFISLFNNASNIKMSIDRHMTFFMKEAVNNEIFPYEFMENKFLQTIKILKSMGSNIFRTSPSHFSSAWYDIIMIGIAQNLEQCMNVDHKIIKNKIENELKKDAKIKKLSGRGANSKERVVYRLKQADVIFKNV